MADIISAVSDKTESVYCKGVDTMLSMRANEIRNYKPYILASYYYMDKKIQQLIPRCGDFMLDSGAFTFMTGKAEVNWNEYIEKYADFINRNKIRHYFELDIDNVVGYPRVKEIRRNLERLTGTPCIPVWHKERGVDEFRGLSRDYSYIAIGGLVRTDYDRIDERFFTPLLETAHANGCRVHGLGYTNLSGLKKYHFDSVDSTTWLNGSKYGEVCRFNGKTIVKTPAGSKRRAKPRFTVINNYIEWLKFQKYADTHL